MNMEIKSVIAIAKSLPPFISVLFRGGTGIGKSHIARQIAEELDMPFIDVRASTMDEAQVSGIPDFETAKETKTVSFVLPSWYMRACNEPVVLMIDEFNRAMPSVMQSFFQVILDRELGNNVDGVPMKLHPETRVIAAINMGNEYDVNDMDPALLRRFWVVDVETSPQDWTKWALSHNHQELLVKFVQNNPSHFMVDPASVAPGTVIPTPASWSRLDESLTYMGLNLTNLAGESNPMLYSVARGFVGTEAAIAFSEFIARQKKAYKPEDVLSGAIADGSKMKVDEAMSLIEGIAEHCKANKWSNAEIKNFLTFSDTLNKEQYTHLVQVLGRIGYNVNCMKFYQQMNNKIIGTMASAHGLAKRH
jgi:MoxR-like ATPase